MAYHHSGLDYLHAGVIEPLAKRGQLQVVVATTGLGAGVNLPMRSILVADREYRVDDRILQLRPDELMILAEQVDGVSTIVVVIVAPKQARLADVRPLKLTRSTSLDWPAIIGVILQAKRMKQDHIQAARDLARKLFSEDRIRLGLEILSVIYQTISLPMPACQPRMRIRNAIKSGNEKLCWFVGETRREMSG